MRTALIMDIDGTIAPYSPKGSCRTYRAHLSDLVVPEVNTEFLKRLKYDAFWLSYRSGFIPHSLREATNIRAEIEISEYDEKYDTILAWAKDNDYDKIVWVDDDYDKGLEEYLVDELSVMGVQLYHCVPSGATGITSSDRSDIEVELGIDTRPIRFVQHKNKL